MTKAFINQIDHREDLTHYGDDELSLRVFNDEYLYTMRNRRALFNILNEQFISTLGQMKVLIDDIAQDNEEWLT